MSKNSKSQRKRQRRQDKGGRRRTTESTPTITISNVRTIEDSITEPEASAFTRIQHSFRSNIEALRESHPFVERSMISFAKSALSKLSSALEAHGIEGHAESEDGEKLSVILVKPLDNIEILRRHETYTRASHGRKALMRSLLLALVGEYEEYCQSLLRCAYESRPELLQDSENKIAYHEILQLGDIDAVKHHVINKIVDKFSHQSKSQQLDFFSDKFGIITKEQVQPYARFAEVIERRNSMAHSSGVCTRKYIDACTKAGFPQKDLADEGVYLEIDSEYFASACDYITQFGINIGQHVWRALHKGNEDNIKDADNCLIDVALQLIHSEQYSAAQGILQQAHDRPKSLFDDAARKIVAINLAQTHKWKGDQDKCDEIIDNLDLSSTEPRFHLAVSVLKEQFDDAAELVRKIGTSDERISYLSYHQWPIFRDFRETEVFMSAYSDVFGEDFLALDKKFDEVDRDRELSDLKAQSTLLEKMINSRSGSG